METEATKEELQRIDFMRIKKNAAGRPDNHGVLPDDRRRDGSRSSGSSGSSDMNVTSLSAGSSDASSDEDDDSDEGSDSSSEEEKEKLRRGKQPKGKSKNGMMGRGAKDGRKTVN